MDKPIIDVFRPEHLSMYDPRIFESYAPTIKGKVLEVAKHSVTASLIDPDSLRVIAMGGICPVWTGCGEVWMFASELLYKHVKFSVRFMRGFMHTVTTQLEINRLQCSVLADRPELHNFVRHFGFESEGLMRKYGPDGKDYVRYARIT